MSLRNALLFMTIICFGLSVMIMGAQAARMGAPGSQTQEAPNMGAEEYIVAWEEVKYTWLNQCMWHTPTNKLAFCKMYSEFNTPRVRSAYTDKISLSVGFFNPKTTKKNVGITLHGDGWTLTPGAVYQMSLTFSGRHKSCREGYTLKPTANKHGDLLSYFQAADETWFEFVEAFSECDNMNVLIDISGPNDVKFNLPLTGTYNAINLLIGKMKALTGATES